jgi:hypothetical protein
MKESNTSIKLLDGCKKLPEIILVLEIIYIKDFALNKMTC